MAQDIVFAGYCTYKGLHLVTDAQAKRLTHLNIAFGEVRNNRVDISGILAHREELERIRRSNPHLAIVLSTGGGGAGGHDTASSPGHLAGFVQSTMEAVHTLALDGIDCDWEFPRNLKEREQHIQLMAAYRRELDALQAARGRKCWLSIAAAAWDRYYEFVDIRRVAEMLDFVNLMTYDMRDAAWPTAVTGHHSNLYSPGKDSGQRYPDSIDLAVDQLVERGVPKEKIVVGAAFYSRQWTGVPDVDHGMGVPMAAHSDYGPDYTAIAEVYERDPAWTRYWDDTCKAPWLFNGETFITYDDPVSLAHKGRFVREKGIRGIMYWVHDADRTGRLFDALAQQLFPQAGDQRT